MYASCTKVAADARLLSLKTTTFGCEEGSLTGESVAVSKFVEPVAADSTIAVSIVLGDGDVVEGAYLFVACLSRISMG